MHYNQIPVVSFGFVLPKDQYLCETLVSECQIKYKFGQSLRSTIDWKVGSSFPQLLPINPFSQYDGQ